MTAVAQPTNLECPLCSQERFAAPVDLPRPTCAAWQPFFLPLAYRASTTANKHVRMCSQLHARLMCAICDEGQVAGLMWRSQHLGCWVQVYVAWHAPAIALRRAAVRTDLMPSTCCAAVVATSSRKLLPSSSLLHCNQKSSSSSSAAASSCSCFSRSAVASSNSCTAPPPSPYRIAFTACRDG